jgi:Hsp20/alpha crystallin family
MAMPQVRRSRGRNLTVVNPTREFEDIYDRKGQLMNLAFGLAPVDVAEGPWILQDRELVITGEVPESEQNAQLSNGVLTVTIPKSEEAKPRQIEIKG